MSTAPGSDDGHAFDSDGVRIAYDDVGEGPPVVLVHGFASNRRTNWRGPRWYDALTDAGRRVIALDLRGHGESGKSHASADYDPATVAADVVNLLDHLGVAAADVVGYSMGARVAVQLLVDHPDRVNAVVLGGVDAAVLGRQPYKDAVVEALEAEDAGSVDHPVGRRFRAFAERQGGDLEALAAVMRASSPFDLDRLADVTSPVLVVAGADDRLADDPGSLADRFRHGEAVVVSERDHMTTVGDSQFKEAALEFLGREGL